MPLEAREIIQCSVRTVNNRSTEADSKICRRNRVALLVQKRWC